MSGIVAVRGGTSGNRGHENGRSYAATVAEVVAFGGQALFARDLESAAGDVAYSGFVRRSGASRDGLDGGGGESLVVAVGGRDAVFGGNGRVS